MPEWMTPLLCPVWCAAIVASLSRMTSRALGERSDSASAVARPTMPPPMIATSELWVTVSRIPAGARFGQTAAVGPWTGLTRAGAPVRRLGDGVRQAHSSARGPRHAHLEGFDLHANVWVGPHDRARLEQLCRYVLRPPLAENRLRRLADGKVRLELKRPWTDGTTHLLFEPVEFLEKLAALTPRPEINLVLYHGLLAPHARWRTALVAYRRADSGRAPDPSAAAAGVGRGRSRLATLLDVGSADAPCLRPGRPAL